MRKGNKKGRVGYGISAASGLPELWIAGRDNDRLDYSCDGIDQQLLQASRPERYPVYGAVSTYQRIANRAVELSAAGSIGNGYNAHSEQ
jgi:hypothetical protein